MQEKLIILTHQNFPGMVYFSVIKQDTREFVEQISSSLPIPYELLHEQEDEDINKIASFVIQHLTDQGFGTESNDKFFKTDIDHILSLIEEYKNKQTENLSIEDQGSKMEDFQKQSPSDSYEKVKWQDYVDMTGFAQCDFFIKLPKNKLFVPLVLAGMEFDQNKQEKLNKHSDPGIYIAKEEKERLKFVNLESYDSQMISQNAQEKIVSIHRDLLNPQFQRADLALKAMGEFSSDLVQEIGGVGSPCVAEILDSCFKNEDMQNDIRSLSSIAMVFARAAGFKTQQVYKDLCLAVMLADVSLANVSPLILNRYYTRQMPDSHEVRSKFHFHSMYSADIVTKRFPDMNEMVQKLILLHHERYDGSGTPNNVKGHAIFPLAQVLGLSVDVFEGLKYRELRRLGLSFYDVFHSIYDLVESGESRQHSLQLLKKIKLHFDTENSKKKAS